MSDPNPVVPIVGVLLVWWMIDKGDTTIASVVATIVALDVAMAWIQYRREVWSLRHERRAP